MKTIYVGQPFKLILNTCTSLANATSIQIRYKKPKNETAYFKTANISTINAQYIEADFTKDDNNVAGQWEFRAYVEFGANTGFVPGTPVSYYIEEL